MNKRQEQWAKQLESHGLNLLTEKTTKIFNMSKLFGLGLEYYQVCEAVYLRRREYDKSG